ncbi:MAG TPA: hypothetical protein VEB88_04355, partial [Candidatus Acidoferrales bacterium]|nr:hypothetical protein [Candidatus Acidoferrales bacterium]
LAYVVNRSTLFSRKTKTGLILYTMGVPEDQVKLMGYEGRLKWEFASPILMPDKIKSKQHFSCTSRPSASAAEC